MKREDLQTAYETGGLTTWFDGQERTDGYVVGNGDAGEQFPIWLIDDCNFISTVNGLEKRFKQLGADGIGLWVNCNKLYVDPIFYHHDLTTAKVHGYTNRELAIWDIANEQEIRL